MGGEDTAAAEVERCRKRDKERASHAPKKLCLQMNTGQVIKGDPAHRERIRLKGIDKVLDKLCATAGHTRKFFQVFFL